MPFAQYSNKRKSGFSSFSAPSPSTVDEPFSVAPIIRQINNTKLRVQDAGFNPNVDDRNWFEKFTNLPQNQNAFLDTLEILGRPGQAVLNAIDKVPMKQENIGQALLGGITGRERVRGSDVIASRGIDDPRTKAILGTILEIGTDPLNLVPGGAIAKGTKAISRPVGSVVKTAYSALENLTPKLRQIRENVAQPAFSRTKDALGFALQPGYKADETLTGGKNSFLKDLTLDTENKRRFLQEESLKNIADTARKAGGVETGIEAGKIMEAPLKQYEQVEVKYPWEMSKKEFNEIKGTLEESPLYGTPSPRQAQEQRLSGELDKFLLSNPRVFEDAYGIGTKYEVPIPKGDYVTVYRVAPLSEKIILPGKYVSLSRKYVENHLDSHMTGRYVENPELLNGAHILEARIPKSDLVVDAANELFWAPKDAYTAVKELAKEKGVIKSSRDTIKKEIPRPIRDMPTDPKIQEAARSLAKSNDVLRNYALENGIEIPELEGYMTHVWSQEERNLRKRGKPIKIDQGRFGIGNPNKKILNQRKYQGSVEEINSQADRKLFEPNAYFATGQGQKRLIDYIQAVQIRRKVLSNPDFAVPYEKGLEDVVPNGVVIDTNNYKFMSDSDMLDNLGLQDKVGGKYIVTKAAKQALDQFQKINTDEGTKSFLKAFDSIQTTWKKLALFSPGYHVRNAIGAMFNNFVGGMNPYYLTKYTTEASREIKNVLKGQESKLFNEYRQQGLSFSSLSNVEFRPFNEPEKSIQKTIENRSKTTGQKVKQRLNPLNAFETSREAGNLIDQVNRYALYKWARETKKMNPEDAAKMVRTVQFDYTNTTPFEKNVLTRVVPFYRWMRNNIPFQIRQFIHKPQNYTNINKARLNAQSSFGIDEENVPDWMKEQFALPVSDDKFFALGLPAGDLTKVSQPLKTVTDSLTPLLKLPLEEATNFNFFYKKPIQKFQGQEKKYQIPGTDKEIGIPIKGAYALEQLGGQIGRGFSQYLQTPESVDQDTKFRMPRLGINSMLKTYDTAKSQYFEKLDELKRLQDLLDYIEQQTGQRPRTVNEIK